MKIKYIGETDVSLTKDKDYEVLSVKRGLYRIVDDTDKDCLFFPDEFVISQK